jgi:hypothetical protein
MDLAAKTYKAAPVRKVMIPKPGGGERPLGIPAIRDRVVQTAAKLVLEPIFEADLEENVYGYRPRRMVMAPKRPHDLNQWEKLMVDIATGVLARIRSEHAASDGDETCEVPAAGAPQPTRSKSRIAPNRTPPWKASASRSGASSRRARSQPLDPIAQ